MSTTPVVDVLAKDIVDYPLSRLVFPAVLQDL